MLLAHPAEQSYALSEDNVSLKIISRDWLCGDQLRREGAGDDSAVVMEQRALVVKSIHDQLLHRFGRVVELCRALTRPGFTLLHLLLDELY